MQIVLRQPPLGLFARELPARALGYGQASRSRQEADAFRPPANGQEANDRMPFLRERSHQRLLRVLERPGYSFGV